MNHQFPIKKYRRGFTLIEMIVATTLLALGVLASMVALSSSTQATTVSEQNHVAALLGQKRLSELELQPDSLGSGDQGGDFGEQYPGYSYKQSVEATDYPNLFQVTVTVQWQSGTATRQRAFTTFLRNDTNTIQNNINQAQQQQQQQQQQGGTGSQGQGGTGAAANGGQ